MSDVSLEVDGQIYEGWTSVEISRALNAVATGFNLSFTERWPGQVDPWPIIPGASCVVRVDGTSLVDGYVDLVSPQFDAGSRTLTAQGRDKAADLVDCSAVGSLQSKYQWQNIGLLRMAKILASPFGVSVTSDTALGNKFEHADVQPDESAFECIERHCRMRGVIPSPDGAGGIILTRAGTQRASTKLIEGENIQSATGTLNHSERFSEYRCQGQGFGYDGIDPEVTAGAEALATDLDIKRYRPMVVKAEQAADTADTKKRAQWEATTRRGRGASASIVTHNWYQKPGGDLWDVNLLVDVDAPSLRLKGTMLVVSVGFSLGSGGTRTTLEMVSPEAYAAQPPAEESSNIYGLVGDA
jgi:prophage tail gpP-like protein